MGCICCHWWTDWKTVLNSPSYYGKISTHPLSIWLHSVWWLCEGAAAGGKPWDGNKWQLGVEPLQSLGRQHPSPVLIAVVCPCSLMCHFYYPGTWLYFFLTPIIPPSEGNKGNNRHLILPWHTLFLNKRWRQSNQSCLHSTVLPEPSERGKGDNC